MLDILLWLVAIAAIVLTSIVVFRATLRFDVNQWLRDRRQHLDENLRILCPHVRAVTENGKIMVYSTYVSPSGTLAWQCQMCGDVTHDKDAIDAGQKYWAENLDELVARHKRIDKLAKKLGRR